MNNDDPHAAERANGAARVGTHFAHLSAAERGRHQAAILDPANDHVAAYRRADAANERAKKDAVETAKAARAAGAKTVAVPAAEPAVAPKPSIPQKPKPADAEAAKRARAAAAANATYAAALAAHVGGDVVPQALHNTYRAAQYAAAATVPPGAAPAAPPKSHGTLVAEAQEARTQAQGDHYRSVQADAAAGLARTAPSETTQRLKTAMDAAASAHTAADAARAAHEKAKADARTAARPVRVEPTQAVKDANEADRKVRVAADAEKAKAVAAGHLDTARGLGRTPTGAARGYATVLPPSSKDAAYAAAARLSHKPGHVFHAGDDTLVVTGVDAPRYYSREDADEMTDDQGRNVKPGWHVNYRAVPVERTAADRAAAAAEQATRVKTARVAELETTLRALSPEPDDDRDRPRIEAERAAARAELAALKGEPANRQRGQDGSL